MWHLTIKVPLKLIVNNCMARCNVAEYLNIDVLVFHPKCGSAQANHSKIHESGGVEQVAYGPRRQMRYLPFRLSNHYNVS